MPARFAWDGSRVVQVFSLLATLDFGIFIVGMATPFALGRLGTLVTFGCALTLGLHGLALVTDLRGAATRQVGQHAIVRPWGIDKAWAWRAWGLGWTAFGVVLLVDGIAVLRNR